MLQTDSHNLQNDNEISLWCDLAILLAPAWKWVL